MVAPPSQLTLRAQDRGHRDLGVTLGRRGVPSGSDPLLGTPPAASLQVPAGTMSRRRALHPGITQEEVLSQHQDTGWGLRDPLQMHRGGAGVGRRQVGGAPTAETPEPEDRLSPCVMVGPRDPRPSKPQRRSRRARHSSRKPVQESWQGGRRGPGQEAQRHRVPGQALGCRLCGSYCYQAPGGEWSLHSRLQGVGGVPPLE